MILAETKDAILLSSFSIPVINVALTVITCKADL